MNSNGEKHTLNYIDSHAHFFLKEFDEKRKDLLRNAEEKGVVKIYMPNLDHTTIDDMLETESRNPSCVAMMGLHPGYVKKDFEKELYIVEQWLANRKFSAVGEIGIDLYWDTTFQSEQEEALKIQISLAEQHQLPIIIHCRNSFKETVSVIEKCASNIKGIFHCFSGTIEEAKQAIEMGFLLGIGGVLTFKNSGLDKIIEQIDLEHLVLETDSPYLTPAPHRKERNDPSYIPLIAQKLADVKKCTIYDVARITTHNAQNLFVL